MMLLHKLYFLFCQMKNILFNNSLCRNFPYVGYLHQVLFLLFKHSLCTATVGNKHFGSYMPYVVNKSKPYFIKKSVIHYWNLRVANVKSLREIMLKNGLI